LFYLLYSVRDELQVKYSQLTADQPLLSFDFGQGQLASLTNGGRLFDVHRNLPSKGIHSIKICKQTTNFCVCSSQRWQTDVSWRSLCVLSLHAR